VRCALALLVLLSAGCSGPPAAPAASSFVLHADGCEADGARVVAGLQAGRTQVEGFFGEPFRGPIDVTLCADRAAFDATFPPAWGVGATQCWMVACGVGGRLALLAPHAWAAQACGHDVADTAHLNGILAHELTHCFHGERNPHSDFDGVEGIDWFCEGLATLVSGQLAHEHAGVAARAVAAGTVPARLRDAWTGPDRYGVSGSLVDYVDVRWGRATLTRLLAVASEAELLAELHTTDADLLRDWSAWVRVGSGRTAPSPP
jgi:hypothetical protein